MNIKKIEGAFNEFNNIISGDFSSHQTDFENKQRRLILESTSKSYNSFVSSNVYDFMDDKRLFDVSIDDEEISGTEIIDRMTDVIQVFYHLRSDLVGASTKICSTGADYFSIIQKKYAVN